MLPPLHIPYRLLTRTLLRRHLDPVNAILSDRYYEAETWPHDLDKPTGVFETVMPLLHSCVLSLPPPDPVRFNSLNINLQDLQYLPVGHNVIEFLGNSVHGIFWT